MSDETTSSGAGGANDNGAPPEALRRDISRLGFSAMTLNSIIGAGIFGLPAVAAASSGDFAPWMFIICGVLTLTIVLSFARASSLVRETGGVIVYAGNAFGPFAGFQTGWLAYLSRVASMAANSNLMVTYLAWFWAPLDAHPWRGFALAAIIGGMTWLNVVGVRSSIGVLYALSIAKLLPLSLLVLFGLGKVDPATLFGADFPPMDEFGATVLILLYAFVGFEGTVVNAGEGKNPRKDIPRALFQTTLVIAVFYFLIQWVASSALPELAESRTALADVAVVLFGTIGAAVLTLGAAFSIGGNLMTSVLSAPRMTWALALDGTLPRWFAAVHPRHQTPHHSIAFYGGLSLALALSGTFVWLAIMSTLVRLMAYMVSIAALPRLEQQTDAPERAFRLPGGLLIPGLALVLCFWLVLQAPLSAWLALAGFALAGTVIYFVMKGRGTESR
ncbi:MAG: amino acid permease [Pseudomonadota bacterium]